MNRSMSEAEALISMLDTVGKIFRTEITKEEFKFWILSLDSYPFDDVRKAIIRYSHEGKKMPIPSDIVKIINGSEEDRSLSALMKVEHAMRTHSGYDTVIFDDPIIHAVIIELGGWIRLGRLTENELIWWKKDFEERYRHHLRMGIQQEVPSKLLGIFDQANIPLGLAPQKPAIVGDRQKALDWVKKQDTPDALVLDMASVKVKEMISNVLR